MLKKIGSVKDLSTKKKNSETPITSPGNFKHINSSRAKQYGLTEDDKNKTPKEKQQKLESEYAQLTTDLDAVDRQVDSLTKLLDIQTDALPVALEEHYGSTESVETKLQLDIETKKQSQIKGDQEKLYKEIEEIKSLNDWKEKNIQKPLPTPGAKNNNTQQPASEIKPSLPPKPYKLNSSSDKINTEIQETKKTQQDTTLNQEITEQNQQTEEIKENTEKETSTTINNDTWETFYTENNEPYYFNKITEETVWELPETDLNNNKINQESTEKETSATINNDTWETFYTENNEPYYYNKITEETVWELPQ